MRTILVDDEPLAMDLFEMEAEKISDIEIVGKFSRSYDALSYVQDHPVEVAFLDVVMPELDGIGLAAELRRIYKDIIIVFVSGHEQYLAKTLKVKADYWMMKPYDEADIRDVAERIRLLAARQKKGVYIQTYEGFQVFIHGKLVHIPNAKARELLALCIDRRGREVRMEEAIDILWEDRVYDERVKKLYRKATICLRKLFAENEEEDVFITGHRFCRIDTDRLTCDYFQALVRGKEEVRRIMQAYLPEYSWAECTAAQWCVD